MPCTPAPLHSGPIAGPLHREVGAHQIHTQAVSGSCSKETAPIYFLVSPGTGYLFLLHQHSSSCTGSQRYGTIDELNLMQGKLARIHKNKFILEFQTKSPQAGGGETSNGLGLGRDRTGLPGQPRARKLAGPVLCWSNVTRLCPHHRAKGSRSSLAG